MKKISPSSKRKLLAFIFLISAIMASLYGYRYGLNQGKSNGIITLADSMSMQYDSIVLRQVMSPHISSEDSAYIGIYLGNSNCKNCNISDLHYIKSRVSPEHTLFFLNDPMPKHLCKYMKSCHIRLVDSSSFFKTSNSLIFLVVGDSFFYPFSIDHELPQKTEEYLTLLKSMVK